MPLVSCIVVDSCPRAMIEWRHAGGESRIQAEDGVRGLAGSALQGSHEDEFATLYQVDDPVFDSHLRRCRSLAQAKPAQQWTPPGKRAAAGRGQLSSGSSGGSKGASSVGAQSNHDTSLEDALAAFGDIATQEMVEDEDEAESSVAASASLSAEQRLPSSRLSQSRRAARALLSGLKEDIDNGEASPAAGDRVSGRNFSRPSSAPVRSCPGTRPPLPFSPVVFRRDVDHRLPGCNPSPSLVRLSQAEAMMELERVDVTRMAGAATDPSAAASSVPASPLPTKRPRPESAPPIPTTLINQSENSSDIGKGSNLGGGDTTKTAPIADSTVTQKSPSSPVRPSPLRPWSTP